MTPDPSPSARQAHWDAVYGRATASEVSWYQPVPERSLALLDRYAAPLTTVVDAGGGESSLARLLAERGVAVTVVDVSARAIEAAREAAGEVATAIHWEVADLLEWRPVRRFAAWHDRAVFHFLTDPRDQARYVETLTAAIEPGGTVIIAAFAPDGPEACSGLPTVRYDGAGLARVLGPHFTLVAEERETHRTPADRIQEFAWAVFVADG